MNQLLRTCGTSTLLMPTDAIHCIRRGSASIQISFYRNSEILEPKDSMLELHLHDFLNGITMSSGMQLIRNDTPLLTDAAVYTLCRESGARSHYKNLYTESGKVAELSVGDYIYCDNNIGTIWFSRGAERLTLSTPQASVSDNKTMLDLPSVLRAIELTVGLTVPRMQNGTRDDSRCKGHILDGDIVGMPLVSIAKEKYINNL